jgi:hypothetical protein
MNKAHVPGQWSGTVRTRFSRPISEDDMSPFYQRYFNVLSANLASIKGILQRSKSGPNDWYQFRVAVLGHQKKKTTI